jgi:hypothetical protein
MSRTLVFVCLLLAAVLPVTSNAAGLSGSWSASVDGASPNRMNLSLRMAHHEHDGSNFRLADFTGLTAAQAASTSRLPVHFELRREAGTIAFDGTFRAGEGGGDFVFTPNHEFERKLGGLGVRFDARRGDEDDELFSLAIFDVSTGFIRSMQALGYREPLEMYEQFRIFDIDPGYVHDLAGVGFDRVPAEKLVETKIQGATPEYIRGMRAAGTNLALEGYIESRIFQVTPEFSAEMGRLGYANLDHDMLMQFRIQGVTPEFVRALKDRGYTRVPAEKLVEMRIQGVTPEFIGRLAAAGYHHVPVDKLIELRIHGIEPEMVKALDDASR